MQVKTFLNVYTTTHFSWVDDATIFSISALPRNLVKLDNISCDDVIKRWAVNAARKISIIPIVKDKEDLALWIKYARGTVCLSRSVVGDIT